MFYSKLSRLDFCVICIYIFHMIAHVLNNLNFLYYVSSMQKMNSLYNGSLGFC